MEKSKPEDLVDSEHKLTLAFDKVTVEFVFPIDSPLLQKPNQTGDQIFNTLNTIIKEGSKALDKMADLQKIKAMTEVRSKTRQKRKDKA